MRVTITGPNVHDGIFHVHRAGCADLNRRPYALLREGNERYTEEHASLESVVLAVYDNGIMEGDETWEDYVGGFYVAPCVTGLPDTV